MDIRKPDAKGRVVIGDDHEAYTVVKGEGGVLTLTPIAIPDAPRLTRQDFRAVYVSPCLDAKGLATVTIHSSIGNHVRLAEFVADIANQEMLPVVIDQTGFGQGIADLLSEKVDRDVITVTPFAHKAKQRA